MATSDVLHTEIQHTNGRVPRRPEPDHLIRGYPSAATAGSQVVRDVGNLPVSLRKPSWTS